MIVKELKAKEPLADVYEINPAGRYIIKLPKDISGDMAFQFMQYLHKMGVGDEVLVVMGDIQILELPPTTEQQSRCIP